MINDLIDRYKRLRTEHFLSQTFQHRYAFVGMGQHSLTNLYPVIHYLGIPLKYVCVTSEKKAQLVRQKFSGVEAVSSLSTVLDDPEVRGVFVAATPVAHFPIASQVLASGKSLFIEKPPCMTSGELQQLVSLHAQCPETVAMAGLQKRYSPAVQQLKRALTKERVVNYDLHYCTGAYPEGDALFDLFIHPLDLVTFLFGRAEVVASREVAPGSFCVMLQHDGVTGMLELSTSYTWTDARESLRVCSQSAVYDLQQLEVLTRQKKQPSVWGIPVEKVMPRRKTVEYLFERSNFVPTLPNNQVFTQGYYNEISAFVEAVEGRNRKDIVSSLDSLHDTFALLESLRQR